MHVLIRALIAVFLGGILGIAAGGVLRPGRTRQSFLFGAIVALVLSVPSSLTPKRGVFDQSIVLVENREGLIPLEQEEALLLMFYSESCRFCQLQKGELNKLAQADVPYTLAAVSYNDFPELFEEYGIEGIPVSMLFRKGKPVLRADGVQSADDLQRLLTPE